MDIESLSTQKPNDFWDKINSLVPKRKVNSIPIEIVDACGHTVTDENAVFERWKNDFCNLYNAPNTQIRRSLMISIMTDAKCTNISKN